MKKLKVLLIMAQPQSCGIVSELGIEFIAAVTEESGREVITIQANENDIDYSDIIKFQPDIVGFTMYFNNVDMIRNISRNLKSMFNNIIMVAGGSLATMNHIEVMQHETLIDYVVRGEGEYTWLELLECIENSGDLSKVKGITYRGKDRIIENQDREPIKDLDSIPYPKKSLIGETSYISTSRGCVRNCSFCNSHDFWKRWRGKSPSKVVDEIEYLVNKGVTYIMLIDNSFEDSDGKCTRGVQIANEIIKRGIKIPYQVNFRAEFWRAATPEIIETLKKSGLIAISVGIETANEPDRILYNKYATLEDNIKIVELFRSYGIHVNTNFIMFNPYSTFEGLRQNINYLEKLGNISWDYISNSYKTLEGTALYNKIKLDGLSIKSVYNDPFPYNYKEPKLVPLIEYFYNIPHEWIGIHNAYVEQYWSSLVLIRKQSEVFQDYYKYDIVKGYEDKAKCLCDTIGHYIAEWFRNLLEIAESGWDIERAVSMENDIMNNYEVLSSFNTLELMAQETSEKLKDKVIA